MDNTQQPQSEQTVEMNIPADSSTPPIVPEANITGSQTEGFPQTPAHPEQPQNQELSTNNPQTDTLEGTLSEPNIPASVVSPSGNTCKYCENKEKYQSLADQYVNRFIEVKEKLMIPFVQELALALNVSINTVNNWADKKTETKELEHPEFAETYEKLMTIQELRLLQRTLGRYNPTGAIFQLKANHNYIETEKKVLTGDNKEPLLIEIINDKKVSEGVAND